jgi:hypothetical protein
VGFAVFHTPLVESTGWALSRPETGVTALTFRLEPLLRDSVRYKLNKLSPKIRVFYPIFSIG